MIVKNEEEQLFDCLNSLKPVADEIIVVDTGSTDRTKAIAAEFTDKIYDFKWIDDFSAARNFAFSKATMEYIYTADADEVIDERNIALFKQVKQVLLPEIEIVQMHYLNLMETNTAYNSKRELRPKLFKRLRNFEWINPVHETVRLTPIVYDSDIEIQHLAKGSHAKRDFMTFQKAIRKGMRLDKVLHSMYAKELFIAGDNEDFKEAYEFFKESYNDPNRSADEKQEAVCVLARNARRNGDTAEFLSLVLPAAISNPCSEICIEIGDYFFENKRYSDAVAWYYDGIYETDPIISVYSKGKDSLIKLSSCYRFIGEEERADYYSAEADKWEPPETV